MRKQLSANFHRLWRSQSLWLFLGGMVCLASVFMMIQYTAMDYTVPLSRVIFLPLSLYGIAAAAFVSVFVGTDFSDGFIRNKVVSARSRNHVVFAHMITSCTGCVLVYLAVTAFSAGVGTFFFENDVTTDRFILFLFLGIGMSIVYGSILCMTTLLCGSKTQAIIWCMLFAMLMLFLSLHTNQILVQTRFKDGALNPHYVNGFKRIFYGILHDINPCGQAAQLSAWNYFKPIRGFICNIIWILVVTCSGCAFFRRKDLK
ncbi:MAG: hypothetical protein ACI4DX_15630 [Oliverpabstia sp.]